MAPVVEKTTADAGRYVAEYEARFGQRALPGPAWLQQLRARAIASFAGTGFPTTRDEEWRFTPIGPIASTAFVTAEALHVQQADLAPFTYGDQVACELVFVNGTFVPALSRTANLPAGLAVAPLAQVLRGDASPLEGHLGALAGPKSSPFAALNTALFEDGALVTVRRGTVVDRPVHVLFYSTVSGAPSVSYPRLLVLAGEHSECRILETYAGPDGQVYFTNAVSELFVGDRAVVDHYKIELESTAAYHVASSQVRTGRDTVFSSHSLTVGGAIVRNDTGALLGAEGGDTTLNGLYLAAGDQLVDNHTTIDHALPHNGSHELYKGILGGKARAVFNGKIIVREDAQKTDAKQTNKALLLSDDAAINTKPQLEIFADDVKCTHGATVGQLDADMLFYLRSRGLSTDAARGLLLRAFAGDITTRVKFEPLKERLEQVLTQRIPR